MSYPCPHGHATPAFACAGCLYGIRAEATRKALDALVTSEPLDDATLRATTSGFYQLAARISGAPGLDDTADVIKAAETHRGALWFYDRACSAAKGVAHG